MAFLNETFEADNLPQGNSYEPLPAGWHNANITVPSGNTIIGIDSPRLDALADNGGLTKTMAPRSNSAAIDAGAANSLSVDQRGTGFPRVYGALADIGALERSPAEANIFSNGFEPD